MPVPVASQPGTPLPGSRLEIGFNETGAVFLGAAVLLLGAVLWCWSGSRPEMADFRVTYVGARIIHQGRAARLYDLDEQERQKQELFSRPDPRIFEHPPFEALLLSPLAALPYRTAYLVWALVNAAIWLSLPFLLRPYLPAPREPLAYLALWFLFAPLGVALFQGQSSLALLALYALCYIFLRRGRDLEAGALLGLGLFKFQFVLPFALIFLLRRKWRFTAGFSASAALLGALSLVAVGWRGILSYVHLLFTIAGHPESHAYGSAFAMATVQGFFNAVLDGRLSPALISVVVAALSLFLIGFTAWCWQRADHERPSEALHAMFAAGIAVALLTGFHMFTHDLSPLALALFLVMAHFPPRSRLALRWVLGVTMTLFWIPAIYFASLAAHVAYLLCPALAVFCFAALYLPRRAADRRGQELRRGW
jgi:Glycosyltransferase family 87